MGPLENQYFSSTQNIIWTPEGTAPTGVFLKSQLATWMNSLTLQHLPSAFVIEDLLHIQQEMMVCQVKEDACISVDRALHKWPRNSLTKELREAEKSHTEKVTKKVFREWLCMGIYCIYLLSCILSVYCWYMVIYGNMSAYYVDCIYLQCLRVTFVCILIY